MGLFTDKSDAMASSDSQKNVMTAPKSRGRRVRPRRGIHIYVLPNLLTTLNMFFGYFAIIYSIYGQFLMAAYAIVAAAIFDLLDGRVARMTHATSEFGSQYDSLSDLVSFGLAPSILLFQWSLQPFGRLGWLACFFYVACGALRLARFNVQKEVIEKAYFQGLPSPMAAGIVASSVMAFNDLEKDATRSSLILGITFLLGFTMVSTFRYRSFKDIDFRRRLPFHYLVFGVFAVAIVANDPEVMLFALFLTYALLGAIFGLFRLGRNHRQSGFDEGGDDLHEEVHDE